MRIVAEKFVALDFGNVILLEQERLSRNLAIAASPFYSHAVSAGRREADVVDGGGGSAEGVGKSSVMNAGKLRTKSRL